jgi:4-carboxymuconolactone decarboxylase
MHQRRPEEPRLKPIEKVIERARSRGDSVSHLRATMAHNRVMATILGEYSQALLDPQVVDPRLRELTTLRMAWNTQCVYEFGQHRRMSKEVGITEQELEQTTRPLCRGEWEPRDLVALQMTDDLYSDDCISDATWAELTEHFTSEEILAIMVIPLSYRLYAGIMNSAGLVLEEGVQGWP